MAINPPSDIVLDVARAADPAARQAAVAKLAGAARSADSQAFAEVVDRVRTTRSMPSASSWQAHQPSTKAAEAYRSFEAFFIQSFIQNMLPKNSEANYGSGTAGDMWRSLSAEHMANAITNAGGLGIAERMMAQDATTRLSSWDQDAKDPGSAFSFGSLSGAKPFQDWASYLPYLDPKHAGAMWQRPAEVGSEQLLAEGA